MYPKQDKRFLIKVGYHADLKFYCETDDINEAKDAVNKYMKEKFPNNRYHRILFYDTHIWIDYGSWVDFIYVYFVDEKAHREYIGEQMWEQVKNQ